MASWRERLISGAKFRGVSFFIEGSERTGGRRNVEHDYPFRDDPPYVEDMGRKGRGFSIEGFVIGSEYMAARDALLDKLEEAGPGELVHPYHGVRRVVVDAFRVRESQSEGGWAKFTIEFKETSTGAKQPTTTTDGPSAVAASASAAQAAVSAEFTAAFDELSSLRDSVSGALRSASLAVNAVTSRVQMATQTVASLKRKVDSLSQSASAIAGSSEDLLSTTVDLVEALAAGLVDAAASGVTVDPSGAALTLYAFNPGTRPPASTPSRAVEQRNFDATQRLFQRTALIQAATIAVGQTFASYEDAVRVRTSITDLIDEQAELVADDTYPILLQLRTDLVRAIPGADGDLPHLISYTPPVTVPSLVLAHRLYGDLSSEADILARNKTRHPGFVAGATELEILSRG